MVDITFRDNGAWGGGKGAPLATIEWDTNFWNIKQAIEALQGSPTQPLQIEDITIVGNQMTILLSDLTTSFTVTIPSASFKWTNAWLGDHAYKAWDVFTSTEGMYLVLQDHTSASIFNPADGNVNGAYYQLIFPYPNKYRFGFFFPGEPGTGIVDGRAIAQHIVVDPVIFPNGLVGSEAYLEDAPHDDLSYPIFLNDIEVGSIDFLAYTNTGTFTFIGDLQTEPGDRVRVMKPVLLEGSARDLTVTFAATVGSLS